MESAMLALHGIAGDPIWVMVDGPDSHPIGIRLDCGDSGVVYLSVEQAEDLESQLLKVCTDLRRSKI